MYRKRLVREAEKRSERVYFKFISSYVKHVHSNIYEEADSLHKTIRGKYSASVRDLTKTQEFMNAVAPSKKVPRYYMRRVAKQVNMLGAVLEIQLLPSSTPQTSSQPQHVDVASPQTSSLPQHVDVASPQTSSLPQHVDVASPQTSSLPQHVDVASPQTSSLPQHVDVASPQTSSLPQHIDVASPQTSSHPLTLLPEATYKQLLEELQQDPELMDILNNFPTTTMQDNDDTLLQDIWEDICPEHITPLEVEIETTIS